VRIIEATTIRKKIPQESVKAPPIEMVRQKSTNQKIHIIGATFDFEVRLEFCSRFRSEVLLPLAMTKDVDGRAALDVRMNFG